MTDHVDLGIITDSDAAIARCRAVGEQFEYRLKEWRTLDQFLEGQEIPRVVVAYVSNASQEGAAEAAQVVRYKCRDSFIICVVPDRLGREVAAFVKKSGAHLILLAEELHQTSKLEYACTQVVKADYLPIKTADLMPGQAIPFDIYHLLPIRQKFLKFAFEGDTLNQEKISKATEVGELYIKKMSAEKFNLYTNSNPDRSARGLARRCRSQFLALYSSYAQLVLLLTDQSEYASFKEGESLLKRCRDLGSELMITLGEFGNAWEIVNNSTIGEFGSTERAPAVAAYAALFGLQIDIAGISDIMIAALLSELGLLLLPPDISVKLRAQELDQLSPEQRRIYELYPQKSLDIVLGRKLPVDEKLRELLISTHERADETGFPRKLPARRISEGAQLVHFCRLFDQKTVIAMGKARVDREDVRREIIRQELQNPSRFSPLFMEKLKKAFP
ncbi:MAG: hypothetical protein A2428_13170 [Bdellovibrionales bacterium RIFOXYC1_FULL_54_43]|nr:MAG: hypothetical protein A2428_13170 [Bdellovibrionales bacterium RIFOXYC1_FULL_54_43]